MNIALKLTTIIFPLLLTLTANAADKNKDEQHTTKPVAESEYQISPLLNGEFMPNISTKTADGKTVNLKDVVANKKTVLFFYRGGWCPFCNTQMGQLKQIEGKLTQLGFQLIGISTDSPADLQKSVDKNSLSYQLLSDYNSTVSQAFGLAFFTSQETTDRYLSKMKLSNPLQKNLAGEARLVLPVPAIYVLDASGLVQFNYVNPNFKVRLHEDLLLKAAELVK